MDKQNVTFINAIKHVLTHKSMTKLGYKMILFRIVLSILTPIYLCLKLLWKVIYQLVKPQSKVYKPKKKEIQPGELGNPLFIKHIK
jgi:hypothetical protein